MARQIAPTKLDDRRAIIVKYKPRCTGTNGKTIEVTIPPLAFEREARERGLTVNEAVKELRAVWRFNDFPGLHLTFEKRNGDKNAGDRPQMSEARIDPEPHPKRSSRRF